MKNQTKIKIVLVDEAYLIRKAFASLIHSEKILEVVAEASHPKELFNIYDEKKPDIVLLGISEPYGDRMEILSSLVKKFNDIKIIGMSMVMETSVILDIISRGAKGFIDKTLMQEEFYRTITETHRNGYYYNQKISQAMLLKVSLKQQNPFVDNSSLTDREVAVLVEIYNGHTNREIAEKLYISESTVNYHKGNIYKKIKSNNPIDAVKYAIRHRYVNLD
jgi:DNA-binding NarL/FixJ family response regulator